MFDTRVGPIVKTATATAAGVASVQFAGPGGSWRMLQVENIALRGSSAAIPTASLYRGPLDSLGALLATEYDGNGGSFTRTGDADTIEAGATWSVVWTGCDPGASMSAALTGTERDR